MSADTAEGLQKQEYIDMLSVYVRVRRGVKILQLTPTLSSYPT